MKKLILLIISAFLCAALMTPTVFAAASVSFSVDTAKCKNNRLVSLDVRAQCSERLSAALFVFTYNQSVLTFRGAEAPKGSKVVYNETAEGVKLSYLCESGADVSEFNPIFTLQFKSVGEGSGLVNFQVKDCVSAKVEQLSVGNCSAGLVTVSDSVRESSTATHSGSSRVSSSSKTKSTSSAISSGKAQSSSRVKKVQSGTASQKDEEIEDFGTINDVIQRDADKLTPMIVLCISLVVAIAFIGFLAYHFVTSRKTKNQGKEDDE